LSIRGKALHVGSRGLVAKTARAPKLGQPVLDSRKKRIGNVSDVFGPVKSPYIVIKPASGISKTQLEGLANSDIYMGEEHGKGRKTKNMPRMRKH